eukprot:scaffold256046_cov17-Prasinocladus_malaysianus.AAC.1
MKLVQRGNITIDQQGYWQAESMPPLLWTAFNTVHGRMLFDPPRSVSCCAAIGHPPPRHPGDFGASYKWRLSRQVCLCGGRGATNHYEAEVITLLGDPPRSRRPANDHQVSSVSSEATNTVAWAPRRPRP